jgi:hypothetical protein
LEHLVFFKSAPKNFGKFGDGVIDRICIGGDGGRKHPLPKS